MKFVPPISSLSFPIALVGPRADAVVYVGFTEEESRAPISTPLSTQRIERLLRDGPLQAGGRVAQDHLGRGRRSRLDASGFQLRCGPPPDISFDAVIFVFVHDHVASR